MTINDVQWWHFRGEEKLWSWWHLGFILPGRPVSPALEPMEVFWRGAEIQGLPPATRGDTASTDCSDMLDLHKKMLSQVSCC